MAANGRARTEGFEIECRAHAVKDVTDAAWGADKHLGARLANHLDVGRDVRAADCSYGSGIGSMLRQRRCKSASPE